MRANGGEAAPFLLDGDVSEFQHDYYQEHAKYAYSWHRGFLGRLEVSLLSQPMRGVPGSRRRQPGRCVR